MSIGFADTGALPGRSTPARSVRPGPRPGLDETNILRWIFYPLLLVSIAVLAFDATALIEGDAPPRQPARQIVTVVPHVVAPGASRSAREIAREPSARRLLNEMRQPMRFSMGTSGVLSATGMIQSGSAERLGAELAAHAGAIRSVSIDSLGGSLDEAIAMARMVRDHGIATEVPAGAMCASSCPLFLAGGVERRVGPGASVGIHQFYAGGGSDETARQAMVDAQLATARIARHLEDMGIDPLIWLKALSTPPSDLYRLTRAEMVRFRLVTTPSAPRRDPARAS